MFNSIFHLGILAAMIDINHMLLLAAASLFGSAIAAVVGFGAATLLLPVLVFIFGPRDAIPILTVAQFLGNASRTWFNRKELDLSVVRWFALGGVPMAVIGGLLFARTPASLITRLLGVFFIATVVYRHAAGDRQIQIPLRGFAAIGAFFSFFSALLGTVGPLMVPFFLAYGLIKGAFIGTEAFATVVMQITKIVVYSGTAVLSIKSFFVGIALGAVMFLGSYCGKKILDRLPERFFLLLIEAFLVVSGLLFLVRG